MTRIEIGEDIAVTRGDRRLEMPKSRKARALLAYLALSRKAVHRSRLSEMFWHRAADPRGGLRWALTRLRRLLGPDEGWLIADSSCVQLACPAEAIAVDRSAGDLLLIATETGDHDEYAAWLVALRGEIASGFGDGPLMDADREERPPRQTIRYATAPDGTRIAYAAMGEGRPVVRAANWLTHLDAELDIPAWSGLILRLARKYCLYRYDERGNGLSDWDVEDLSFDAFVSDLECVIDTIALERFPLIGISQGAPVCIEYAARHPERVSGLVLIGGYPAGWRFDPTPGSQARREAEMTLVRHGWGANTSAYRQIFSQTFFSDVDRETIEQFNEFQRLTTSAENAARFIDCFGNIDVRARLGGIQIPTLVLHSRGDERIAFGVGAELAASMPNAELRTLASRNHLPHPGEPAFSVMMQEIERFIDSLD